MTTELFPDLPKGPTRQERLDAFKSRLQIETMHSPDCKPPWMALAMEGARRAAWGSTDKSTMAELVALAGDNLDAWALTGYGETELEAVDEVCRNLKLEFFYEQ